MTTIAAFDLGIKNLSLCVATFDGSGALAKIHRWTNMNLLAGGAESQTQTRCACGGPASWSSPAPALAPASDSLLCKRCAKKSALPPLLPSDISGNTLAAWRMWAVGHVALLGLGAEAAIRKATKVAIMEAAAKVRLMPYKAKKATGVSLQDVLAGMETALTAELPVIAKAAKVRIENQPSEFAPHMKSVQMMLFALVSHRLRVEHGWTGSIEFANASVKTKDTDTGTGKDAKRSRKMAAIEKVALLLTAAGSAARAHLSWWQAQAKQDDLADAFLMCSDGTTNTKVKEKANATSV
jgi:hypothetical protein